MKLEKNTFPMVGTIRRFNGSINVRPFYSESEFIELMDDEEPAWAILIEDVTGRVVVQVSYPENPCWKA